MSYVIFVSSINENVMDLQSPVVNCSASSTGTEGKRHGRNIWSCQDLNPMVIKLNCCSNFGGYPEIERSNWEELC